MSRPQYVWDYRAGQLGSFSVKSLRSSAGGSNVPLNADDGRCNTERDKRGARKILYFERYSLELFSPDLLMYIHEEDADKIKLVARHYFQIVRSYNLDRYDIICI